MAKNIVRLDIMEGKPRTFVHTTNLENGYFLEITGKVANAELSVDADYEAYSVKLATATTEIGDLLFHKSVENQYDERLLKSDFELQAGRPGRGYVPTRNDIVTIPAEMCGATVDGSSLAVSGIAVGDKLKLTAGGKLAKSTGTEGDIVVAKVEAIENIVIPYYPGQWGVAGLKDQIQVSAVIRFTI